MRRAGGRDPLAGELALAAFAHLAVSVGFASWWSRVTFDQPRFGDQYHQGIYRYRLIGTGAVEGVADLVGNPLGERLGPDQAGELFTGLVAVNGVSFLIFVVLSGALLSQAGIGGARRTVLQLLTIALVALSSFVVTPYDDLALVWMAAVVLAARAGRPWDLLAPALVVVGVATRETALLGAAVLVATVLAGERAGRAARMAWSTLGAGCAAYVGLRLVLGGAFQVRQGVSIDENLTTPVRWMGLTLAVLLVVAWVALTSDLTGGPSPSSGRRWLYILSLPYVVLVAATAGWFEVRVLVPILLADLWVRLPLNGGDRSVRDA